MGSISLPFESGQITVVLRHTDWVTHRLTPHVSGLRYIPLGISDPFSIEMMYP